MAGTEHLKVERDGHVLVVTMNRPEAIECLVARDARRHGGRVEDAQRRTTTFVARFSRARAVPSARAWT